jgi:hypothetical protein
MAAKPGSSCNDALSGPRSASSRSMSTLTFRSQGHNLDFYTEVRCGIRLRRVRMGTWLRGLDLNPQAVGMMDGHTSPRSDTGQSSRRIFHSHLQTLDRTARGMVAISCGSHGIGIGLDGGDPNGPAGTWAGSAFRFVQRACQVRTGG